MLRYVLLVLLMSATRSIVAGESTQPWAPIEPDQDKQAIEQTNDFCVHLSAIAYRLGFVINKYNLSREQHERELDREFPIKNFPKEWKYKDSLELRQERLNNLLNRRQVEAIYNWISLNPTKITKDNFNNLDEYYKEIGKDYFSRFHNYCILNSNLNESEKKQLFNRLNNNLEDNAVEYF